MLVQAHHQRCLHDFVEAQASYYAQCNQYMVDLQRQLGMYAHTPLFTQCIVTLTELWPRLSSSMAPSLSALALAALQCAYIVPA